MNLTLKNRTLQSTSKYRGFLFACISAATYGLIPLFTLPVMNKGVGYDSILFYRFALAAIVLAFLMKIKGISFKISKKELISLTVLGFLYFGSSMFLIWSYLYMPAGLATTLLFLYPVFVVLVMSLLFKEKVSLITCISICGAICGVCLLYGGEGNLGSFTGLFLVLGSALSYGLYMIVVNKSSVKNMDGIKITFYATSITALLGLTKTILGGLPEVMLAGMDKEIPEVMSGGILAGILGGILEILPDAIPDMASFINIGLLALIPTVLSCVALAYAVQEVGATYTAALGALEPLTAVIVGMLVFGEPHTWNVFGGIALIIASVITIVLWGLKK